ncbi:hypothetical protein Nmel_004194 [Mimus melanotis]
MTSLGAPQKEMHQPTLDTPQKEIRELPLDTSQQQISNPVTPLHVNHVSLGKWDFAGLCQ